MSVEEYEQVRSGSNRFLVLPGHQVPGVEEVVESTDRYLVVSKLGVGGEVAAGLDPRQTQRLLMSAGAETVAGLRGRVVELEAENEHLRVALASRIVIEQAKGVLIERLELPADEVFELLRRAARRSRLNLHAVAAEILKSRVTPEYIEREIGHLIRGHRDGSNNNKT